MRSEFADYSESEFDRHHPPIDTLSGGRARPPQTFLIVMRLIAVTSPYKRRVRSSRKELKSLREYLKQLREAKGLTMQELSEKLGITRQYYQMIESGERQRKMDIPIITGISKALGVPVEYIVNEESKIMEGVNA